MSKKMVLILALSLPACGAGNLPDYIKLGDLRVLALQADTPEVIPATLPNPRITPVVSDFALGRPLTYSATGCIDPGVGYGAKPTCAGAASATVLDSGSVAPADYVLPFNTAVAPDFAVPIPPTILTDRNPIDQYNGVAYLVVYTLTATNADGSTSQVVSFKRIIASSALHTPKNTNPVITSVSAGAQALGTFITALSYPLTSTEPVPLTPAFAASSEEPYSLLGTDGTPRALQETLTTTWFISDGEMAFYRTTGTDANGWTAPATAPTTTGGATRGVFFVVVTRDGRGGEDFEIFK